MKIDSGNDPALIGDTTGVIGPDNPHPSNLESRSAHQDTTSSHTTGVSGVGTHPGGPGSDPGPGIGVARTTSMPKSAHQDTTSSHTTGVSGVGTHPGGPGSDPGPGIGVARTTSMPKSAHQDTTSSHTTGVSGVGTHPGGPGSDPGPGIGVARTTSMPKSAHQDTTSSHTTRDERRVRSPNMNRSTGPSAMDEAQDVFKLFYQLQAEPRDNCANVAAQGPVRPDSASKSNSWAQQRNAADVLWDADELPPYELVPSDSIPVPSALLRPSQSNNTRRLKVPTTHDTRSYYRRRYEKGFKHGVLLHKEGKNIGQAGLERIGLTSHDNWGHTWQAWWNTLCIGYTPVISVEPEDGVLSARVVPTF
ncbi:hypothetical protein CALCODRAFT_487955 [Calocera cornea HHB12733]|uniref:Uncharacterized protein n=1 Tax=Calocera cornea HHB12733 TaxID=1353952 RepID=A0A165CUA7_9BASI|nr:hypothetical protein CALCODRAFT_487955 [Calocera cornea HHB12733]